MPKCVQIQKPLQKVCSGDMRDKIIIQVRAITAPGNGVDFTETLNQDKTVWSAIKTVKGVEIFDNTNMSLGFATHYFYIRYIKNINKDKYLTFENNYYTIIDVQDLDERHEFLLLRCNLRGSVSNTVNQA